MSDLPQMINNIVEAELALEEAIENALREDPELLASYADDDTDEKIEQWSDRRKWYPAPIVIHWTVNKERFKEQLIDEVA